MADYTEIPIVGLPKPDAPLVRVARPLIKVPKTKWVRDPGISELIDYFDRPELINLNNNAERWAKLKANEIAAIFKVVERCRADFTYAARNFFKIRTKNRGEILFSLWEGQQLLLEFMLALKAKGVAQRVLIIKGRQLGCSTLIEALIAWRTMFFEHVTAFVIADEPTRAANLFSMMLYFIDRVPWWLQPMVSSRKYEDGLVFENKDPEDRRISPGLDSRVIVNAANKLTGIGQSYTVNALHFSEFPSCKDREARTIIEEDMGNSLADNAETFAFLEGTAKGAGRYAHKLWIKSFNLGDDSKWHPIFLPSFFESSRVRVPMDGWIICQEEEDIRDRVLRDWTRCDNRDCLQYHERRFRGQDREGTSCPTCETGILRPYTLTDAQCAWFEHERKNCENDAESLKNFNQELCVSGDTRISSPDGILQIRAAGDIKEVESGYVAKWMSNGTRPLMRLTTKMGRTLSATGDHLIALADGSWKTLQDLAQGDTVKLKPPRFAQDYYTLRWKHSPKCDMSIKIDKDWGRLLGYFMGDGFLKGGGIGFACDAKDQDVVADICKLLRETIGSEPIVVRKGGMDLVTSNSVKWKDILWELGCLARYEATPGHSRLYAKSVGQRHRNVCVPDCIWRSPREVVKEFVSAVFECDGHAYRDARRAVFFTKWDAFARDIQLLLLGFGINCSIAKESKYNKAKDYTYAGNSVMIKARAVGIFYETVGFISERKQGGAMKVANGNYGKHAHPHVMEDAVLSVDQAGEGDVYDLTVFNTHQFSANGIIAHNCLTPEDSFQSSGFQSFSDMASNWAKKNVEEPYAVGIVDKNAKFHGCDPRKKREPVPVVGEAEDIAEPWYACFQGTCALNHRFDKSPLQIFRFPEKGRKYFIGADVGEGLGGDNNFSVAVVLKAGILNQPDEEVAVYRSNSIDRIAYAELLVALGYFYNKALIAVESNRYDTVASWVQTKLNYPNCYRARLESGNQSNKLGWETTERSKGRLYDTMYRWLEAHQIIIHSRNFVEEMKTFKRIENEKGNGRSTYSAAKGFQDDHLMGAMLALFVCHAHDYDENLGYVAMKADVTLDNCLWQMRCLSCNERWPAQAPTERSNCPKCNSMHISGMKNPNYVKEQIEDPEFDLMQGLGSEPKEAPDYDLL